MKRTSLAIIAALVCGSAPFAIGSASAQDASASSPSAKLDRLVWDGTCSGQIMATGKEHGYATTTKYHGEKTLDGHWVVIRFEDDQTAVNPKPYKVIQYVGYDPVKQQYLSVYVANGDGLYGTGVSAGWKGNSLTFDEADPPGSKHVAYRDTFNTSESGGSDTDWMRDKHGKWVKVAEETCHKT